MKEKATDISGVESRRPRAEAAASDNVVWHRSHIPKADLERNLGQRGCVLWFTGLSGSGKSTIAAKVEFKLFAGGHHPFVLDGDNVRHGLCGDLGFSVADRRENIRRVANVAGLFADAGMIALSAFIAPFAEDREKARQIVGPERFLEIYVKADVDTCAARDPKGLYKKALAGELKDFTGVSAPYEEPQSPALVLDTRTLSLAECVERCVALLRTRGLLAPPPDVSP